MSEAIQTGVAYGDAIQSLGTLIPELLGVPGAPRRKFSLDEIRILSAALGNPHRKFASVLVAGTNGKGSTSATLASIAQASGVRAGLYTSPHLVRVNERFRVDGMEIPDETFADLYFRVLAAARTLVSSGQLAHLPSYFELLTALAFLYFAEAGVDLAILEVGMGGRLDATNLVDPVLSVITDIALDHQEWLGETIALIAREKAGILRENGVLVTLPQHPEASQALGEAATGLNVRAISAAPYTPQIRVNPVEPYAIEVLGSQILVDSPLKGVHQHRNIALAVAAAVALAEHRGLPVTPASIECGIRSTRWPGRFESLQVPNYPEILLDVAHNPAGAWALRAALSAHPPQLGSDAGGPHLDSEMWKVDPGHSPFDSVKDRPPHAQCLIFACLRDKPLREMAQILFPIFDHVVLAPIHSPRATDMAELLAAAAGTGTPSASASTVAEAIEIALGLQPAGIPFRIVVSGSVYLVGEARSLLLNPKAPVA